MKWLTLDRDLDDAFDSVQLGTALEATLLCTCSNPGLRPRMFEVVNTLESVAGSAEQTEETHREVTFGRSWSCYLSFHGANEASSFIVEAIELSGPR